MILCVTAEKNTFAKNEILKCPTLKKKIKVLQLYIYVCMNLRLKLRYLLPLTLFKSPRAHAFLFLCSWHLLIEKSKKRERENGVCEKDERRRCARAGAHLHIRVGGLTQGYTLQDTWRSSIVYNVIIFRDIRSVCATGGGRGREMGKEG